MAAPNKSLWVCRRQPAVEFSRPSCASSLAAINPKPVPENNAVAGRILIRRHGDPHSLFLSPVLLILRGYPFCPPYSLTGDCLSARQERALLSSGNTNGAEIKMHLDDSRLTPVLQSKVFASQGPICFSVPANSIFPNRRRKRFPLSISPTRHDDG